MLTFLYTRHLELENCFCVGLSPQYNINCHENKSLCDFKPHITSESEQGIFEIVEEKEKEHFEVKWSIMEPSIKCSHASGQT